MGEFGEVFRMEREDMIMRKLLKKIYNNVLVYERNVINMNKDVEKEISILVEPYATKLSDDEMEELKNLLSAIALTAEQTGFEMGIRFTIKSMISLIMD